METSKWKWFRYQDIFDIQKWKRLTVSDMEEGNYPYIASWSTKNGVVAYVDDYTHNAGCITFACYGSIWEVFYHENPIWASDNVNVLIFKSHQPNRYTWLFIASLLDREKYRFSYGLTAKMQRLQNLKIKLPVVSSGTPDWDWIERYVKDVLIPRLPQSAQELFSEDFSPHAISEKKLSLDTRNWKSFRYDEAFTIEKGYYNKKPEEIENGNIIFIGATESNNGITSYHDENDVEKFYEGNCITVSNNGSVWNAFYQAIKFTCSHDVNVLRPKSGEWNKYSSLFVCTLIEKEKYRWAYGRKWRPSRMPDSVIKLPITSIWTPDWQWMEEYIKSLPYSASL